MARPRRDRFLSALPSRMRRWSADEARTVLAQLDASGLTVQDFAAQVGIDPQRLYHWRARLRGAPPAFVEIARTSVSTSAIDVVLHSGRVLRVTDGFGEETLRRLVQILDKEEPC